MCLFSKCSFSPLSKPLFEICVSEASSCSEGAHGLGWPVSLFCLLVRSWPMSKPIQKRMYVRTFKGDARTEAPPGKGRVEPLAATRRPWVESISEKSQHWRSRARTSRNTGSFDPWSPMSHCKWNLGLRQLYGLTNRSPCLNCSVGFSVMGKGVSVNAGLCLKPVWKASSLQCPSLRGGPTQGTCPKRNSFTQRDTLRRQKHQMSTQTCRTN